MAALSAYWALDLEQNAALMRCVSVLLSSGPEGRTIDWCHIISRMPLDRRVHFAELLIESGAFETEPDEEIIMGLVRANALSGDDVYRHRMFYALSCVREKCCLDYANDGFLLANDYYEYFTFEEVASLHGTAEALKPFAEYVADSEDWWCGSALRLWERCSELQGFKELFEQLHWRDLDPESALSFFNILGDIVYEELGEKKQKKKWLCMRQWADHMIRTVERVHVKYRHKALDALSNILWVWDDPKEIDIVLEPFCKLLARFCAPPFKEREYANYPLTAFTSLPSADWSVIEKCGDASFLRLESETARKNDATLIGQALWTMCELHPRMTADSFVRYPKQLFKAAHTLGVLEVPVRREIIKTFTMLPLVNIDVSELSAAAMVSLVEDNVGPGITDPVPRRLREHLKGGRALQPAQIERDLAIIRDSWLALQLDVLNRMAYDRLSVGMPPVQRTSKVRHALMIQQVADENRRSLRRLLKAYLSGHKAYAEQHPQNREWLLKHPRIDPAKWTQGIRYRCETTGYGNLDLFMEQDSLEVLRLGSYFGTCLGVGGGLSYSAAAITLDINKQVVYARSATGRVIARQLLAIAEDDRLVCFSVYPASISKEVRGLFREYDLRLAVYLGVDICKGQTENDDEYEIAYIVSNKFWDDDAWNLDITVQSS